MSVIGAPDYLQELERELADLAPDERADLLQEVEASLLELEDDPAARFGPPARFAAELRASAGLPPAPSAPPRRAPLRERVEIPQALKELAPIWWAARAYVLTLVLAAAFAAPVTKVAGIPRFGSAEAGAVILAAALVASIAYGLAGRRRTLPARSLRIALDLILAGCAVFLLFYETDRRMMTGYSYEPEVRQLIRPGLANYGRQVQNVYVFDEDGKLLQDVRLYDDAGQPLSVLPGDQDPQRRVLKTRSGTEIFNTFPILYFEPGTQRVARPDSTPPNLNPPPLSSRRPSSP